MTHNFKKTIFVASLFFVLCFVLVSVPVVQVVNARPSSTLVVPDAYSTIQSAIDDADDGDTVYVKSGFYTEHLVINKSISLIGEGKESTTIFRGNSYTGAPTIVVSHDAVNITGFTLQNALSYVYLPNVVKTFSAHYGAISGIHLLHVKDCNIYENKIIESGCGVWFFGSQNNKVFDNTIMNCSYGIVVSHSQNNSIEQNEVTLCYSGVFVSSSSFNVLKNNFMTNNSYSFDVSGTQTLHYNNDVDSSNLVNGKKIYYFFGLADAQKNPESCPDAALVFLVNCTNVNVTNFDLLNGGLFLVDSSNSTLSNNSISDTTLGISLRSCSDIIVSHNTLRSVDETAIMLESSDQNQINENRIEYTKGYGIKLSTSNGNNITRNMLKENLDYGVWLYKSHKNTVFGNALTNSEMAISLQLSAENNIIKNRIFSYPFETKNLTQTFRGIWFSDNCDRSKIIGNNIINCEMGIGLDPVSVYVSTLANDITNCGMGLIVGVRASTFAGNTITNSSKFAVSLFDVVYGLYNTFYNNNFIDNANQTNYPVVNDWVYGSNGNYWSDYNGADLNGDGIGDTPYVLDDNNQDIYPLMVPVERFDVGTWGLNNYYIDAITNSVVSHIVCNPDQKASIKFNLETQTENSSFWRVTIPKDFMNSQGNWIVLVDDEPVSLTVTEEAENTFLNFVYYNNAHSVEIIGTTAIPEFSSFSFALIAFVIFVVALITYRRGLPEYSHGRTNL